MSKPYTIAIPRFFIKGEGGEHYDSFNKKVNAIEKAIELSIEYPGNTFQVVKKVFQKETIVFSYQIKINSNISDLQDIYKIIINIYSKKFNKIKYWRK